MRLCFDGACLAVARGLHPGREQALCAGHVESCALASLRIGLQTCLPRSLTFLPCCSPHRSSRLAEQCRRLTGLSRLHIHDSLSAKSTAALLSSLPRLRCLRLTVANWTADVAAGLAQQAGLTQLRLRLFGGFIPLLTPANYSRLTSLGHLTLW